MSRRDLGDPARQVLPCRDEPAVGLDRLEVRPGLLGELVFGLDDETMESVVLDLCRAAGLQLAVAESVTGGIIASRMAAVPGASGAFLGGVVAYEAARQLVRFVRERLAARARPAPTG